MSADPRKHPLYGPSMAVVMAGLVTLFAVVAYSLASLVLSFMPGPITAAILIGGVFLIVYPVCRSVVKTDMATPTKPNRVYVNEIAGPTPADKARREKLN